MPLPLKEQTARRAEECSSPCFQASTEGCVCSVCKNGLRGRQVIRVCARINALPRPYARSGGGYVPLLAQPHRAGA